MGIQELGEDQGLSSPSPQPNLREAGSNPPAAIIRRGERPREPKLCREVRARADACLPDAGSGAQGVDHLCEPVGNPCVHVSFNYQSSKPSTTLAACIPSPLFYARPPAQAGKGPALRNSLTCLLAGCNPGMFP